MKKPARILGLIFLGLALLLSVVFILFYRHLRLSGLPVYEGTLAIPGLTAPVEVIRDEYGIPSILASNEPDLYLATGYVMAQDRLWQMDLLRRVAAGRLAEVFGASLAETDLLLRALRIPEKARQVLASTPASVVANLEVFAAGINTYLQAARNNLPLEFKLLQYEPEPWSPEHSAYLVGYMGWDLAFAWGMESILWQVEARLKGQEEKLRELLTGPTNPVFVYTGFSLPGASPATINRDPMNSRSQAPFGEKAPFFGSSQTFFLLGPSLNCFLGPQIEGNKLFEGGAAARDVQADKKITSQSFTLWEDIRLTLVNAGLLETGAPKSNHISLHPYLQVGGDKAALFPSSWLDAARELENRGLVIFNGSNNWAVAGSLSSTGQPILANDMHLSLSLPGIWYPLHQFVEGGLHVSGVALPGEPFIVAGHNEHIAWGMTNAMADDIDFYLETVDTTRPGHYYFEGEWRPIESREEVVKIKGGKELRREIRFTHRGPVISEFKDIKDKVISMRWTGFGPSNELLSVYLLNRAKNWSEFREALRFFRSLCQNVIYADVEGNIGLQLAGGIPRRKVPGWQLLPGETAEFDWADLVPFDELPFVFNPACGYVLSANNQSIGLDYPYPISYFFLSQDRAERIKEFLASKQKFSAEDMASLQADVHSKLVMRLKPQLDKMLENLPGLSSLEKEVIRRLKEWKGEMTATSAEATIFEVLYYELGRQMLEDELGEELCRQFISWGSRVFLPYFLEQVLEKGGSAWSDDFSTPEVKETLQDIVSRSFRQTVAFLGQTRGKNLEEWQWGKVHQLTLQHPLGRVRMLATLFGLNRGPYPVGGSFHTVCPFGYSYGFPFRVNHGASQRHIYLVGNWDDSLTVIPAGVSGIPASSHYADQLPLYLGHKDRPDIFNPDLLAKKGKYHLRLIPR